MAKKRPPIGGTKIYSGKDIRMLSFARNQFYRLLILQAASLPLGV